ncbi:hypothetical protein B0I35DRAFT_502160, partial [Stachybotrys elegans]
DQRRHLSVSFSRPFENTLRSPGSEHSAFSIGSPTSPIVYEDPHQQSSRYDNARFPNDARGILDFAPSQPSTGSPKPHGSAMAGSGATARGPSPGAARNSSIDSAISALSTKSNPAGSSSEPEIDIAGLIKAAGSPEAVIRHLLKEKQAQAQQNSQLWRLVDKQRAMILGLNKDLERALKDKEKYRGKLKEMMADPAVSKAAGAEASRSTPKIRVPAAEKPAARVLIPDSPTVETDSQKLSPSLDVSMAPYPITPPADQPNAPPLSAVENFLNPKEAMPKPQEHALDNFDHEADDKAADQERKDKAEQQLKELPFNMSLPPSRGLPGNPPKVPPPRPPALSLIEATPQPDEGLSKFPSPPPRKPPPAPLRLKSEVKPTTPSTPEDEDSDSDYDELLEVDEIIDDKRGRRRTREEDDRERTMLAIKEAEARSASKKSKSSQPASPTEALPTSSHNVAVPQKASMPTSMANLMASDAGDDLMMPTALKSPGLPMSPRPFGGPRPGATKSAKPATNGPLSPRLASLGGPLSPRPPRQPIPLPPNTSLASPRGAPILDGSLMSPNPPSAVEESGSQRFNGRSAIYQGLVTEEYPDLLLPPNALPSIQIRVASSRMKPSRASLITLTQLEEDPVFTLAIISRSDRGELWRVEKDSASLSKLDQRLKQCPAFTAKTPEKSLFSGHAPAKLDARRIALDQYMDELLNTPLDTPTAVELCKYLSSNTLPPNADEIVSPGNGSTDGQSPKSGPGGRPFRSGYLTKRGKNFGGWKARFFVLDGPHLKYYECPGGAHLGTIKLQNAQIGKQAQSSDPQSPTPTSGEDFDNHYRHAFLILEPKRKDSSTHIKHVLCAESDTERDSWVDALLRWIDYRDPDEQEQSSKSSQHDRPKTANAETGGGKAKRNHGKSHHPSDSDTLVGVKYDSTSAGEAPSTTPVRPKTSGGHPEHPALHIHTGETMSSHPNKVISGPMDAHAIPDAAAWGNKQGLGVPTNDEKKLRKRSFFGFGPKTRSSSDGQDSLFGGSEGGLSSTPPQTLYHGPVRQVFGASLGEAVRYNAPTDVRVPLPAVVYRCIQYLDAKNAILEEGIFRLSGSNIVVKQLRERFNTEGDVNLLTDDQYYDIHAVASLLKLYLRELPTTILTRDLHLEFLTTTELTDRQEKLRSLQGLVLRLPLPNATLLKYLIAFLIKIINNADVNKMTVRNVGIVFSPTLNIPAPVFAIFLQNYEAVFGIEPEEYELPSPESEHGDHGRADATPRFDPPRRPSASSGSSSPQRQYRNEPGRDHQRSTPTPPLLMSVNGARSSPTPPLASRPYDQPYALQPRPGSSTGQHRAYHDGSHPGQEPHQAHPLSRAAPAYDRPNYPTPAEDSNNHLPVYDQPNRRRESAMFMGGLMVQGSKSRLREETRF